MVQKRKIKKIKGDWYKTKMKTIVCDTGWHKGRRWGWKNWERRNRRLKTLTLLLMHSDDKNPITKPPSLCHTIFPLPTGKHESSYSSECVYGCVCTAFCISTQTRFRNSFEEFTWMTQNTKFRKNIPLSIHINYTYI